MAIQNTGSDEMTPIMEALNAAKNGEGLSLLGREVTNYSISWAYRQPGHSELIESRRDIQVYWDYKGKRFTREPKFGETIWVANLKLATFKSQDWLDAVAWAGLKEDRFAKELGKYVWKRMNATKVALLQFHSEGGWGEHRKDFGNYGPHWGSDMHGAIQPEHIEIDQIKELYARVVGNGLNPTDLNTIKNYSERERNALSGLYGVISHDVFQSYARSFDTQLYDAFETTGDWRSVIPEQSSNATSSSIRKLVERYGWVRFMENECNVRWSGAPSLDDMNSFKSVVSTVDHILDKPINLDNSEIILNTLRKLASHRLIQPHIGFRIWRTEWEFLIWIGEHSRTALSGLVFNLRGGDTNSLTEVVETEHLGQLAGLNLAYLGVSHKDKAPLEISADPEFLADLQQIETNAKIFIGRHAIDAIKTLNDIVPNDEWEEALTWAESNEVTVSSATLAGYLNGKPLPAFITLSDFQQAIC